VQRASFMLLGFAFLLLHGMSSTREPAGSKIFASHTDQNALSEKTGSTPSFLQSTEARTYTLRGTVFNSATGDPVRGALVQVIAEKQRSMLTGPDGKFQFEGLAQGTYTVQCRKPGFFAEEEIALRSAPVQFVKVAPDMEPVVVKLIPEGLIYGRISGDNGEPIEALPIHLISKGVMNGEAGLQDSATTRTNEDGEFRLASLLPGIYYLYIGPGQTPVVFPSRSSEPGAKGYPGVFYPAANDLASASPIQITPGKRSEILLPLAPVSFYRVSGTISGYPQGQSVNMEIHNAAEHSMATNSRVDQRTGEFQTGWIPGGSYTIRASSSGDMNGNNRQFFTASRLLNVSSNLAGVTLALVPGVTIPVSVRVETAHAQPESDSASDSSLGPAPEGANILLSTKDGFLSRMQYAAEYSGGPGNQTFAVENVPPGTYSAQISTNGPYYVQSATSGPLDLLRQDLTVAPGSSIPPIDIVLRDDAATLHGTVAFHGKENAAIVLLMPEHGQATLENIVRDEASISEFEFPTLAPGVYMVFAFDRIDGLEYANPEVMQKYLPKAQQITLAPKQSATVQLEMIHLPE
jgi:hypothetical protein